MFKLTEDKPDENWPYGKPGAGAGPSKQITEQPQSQKFTQNTSNFNNSDLLPPQPPNGNTKSRKYKEALEEYNRINETVAAINAAEAKLKKEMAMDATNRQQNQIASNNNSNAFHDQSRVPAAMRTSINFGVSDFKFT